MIYYCSHAYGGKEENKKLIEEKIRKLQLADTANTYFSPVHAFGFMYDDMDYEIGLEICLDMLERSDYLIVLSEEISRGVKAEIELAEKIKMPIIYANKGVKK